jgi:mannosyltransferase
MTKRKFFRILLITLPFLLVILNLCFKLIGITKEGLSGDEPFTVFVAHRDFSDLITYLSNYNNPPLHEILLHFWLKIFGNSEFSLRVLPLLFSSASVFYVYKTTQLIRNAKAALLASLLFSFSSYLFFYAQETRVYSLFLFLSLVSIYSYFQIYKNKSWKYKLIFVLSTSLLLYAHYFGFFVLFVQGLMLLINPVFRKKIVGFLLLYSLVFLLYLPQIYLLYLRFSESVSNGTWVEPVKNLDSIRLIMYLFTNSKLIAYHSFIILGIGLMIYTITKTVSGKFKKLILFFSVFFGFAFLFSFGSDSSFFFDFHFEQKGNFIFPLFALIAFAIYQFKSNSSAYSKFVLSWVLLPPIAMFFLSFKIPMFIDRYMIYYAPAFYIIFALGIYRLPKKTQIPLSLFLVAVLFFSFHRIEREAHLSDLALKVKELKVDDSQVIICPDYFDVAVMYYYDRTIYKQKGFHAVKGTFPKYRETLRAQNMYSVTGKYDPFFPKLDSNKRLIFVDSYSNFCYPNNGVLDSLKEFYNITDSIPVFVFKKDYRVYLFESKSRN